MSNIKNIKRSRIEFENLEENLEENFINISNNNDIESDSDSDSDSNSDNTNKRQKIIDKKLVELVFLLEKTDSLYYDFDKIKNNFIKSLDKYNDGLINKCLECGIDMGRSNPRQLCDKTHCGYQYF